MRDVCETRENKKENSGSLRLSPVRAERWVVFHHTLAGLLEVDGVTRRGLELLHEELTLGRWRTERVPDGFRIQADALRRRVERLLQNVAEEPR